MKLLNTNKSTSNESLDKVSGIYVAIDYNHNANFILDKIAKDLKITPDNGVGEDKEYKYHTTIIYSRFPKPLDKNSANWKLVNFQTKNGSTIFKKSKPKISVPVKIIGFGFFDTPDGRNLHVQVSSPFLNHEFKRAVDYGLPTDFPKYTPHITLKNSVPKDFEVPKEIIRKYKDTILYSNDEYIETLTKK